ncbi:MAG: iron hydrogenase [Bacillota bacterium]|nr:iron hydrogenase [Bacillota bacterium]
MNSFYDLYYHLLDSAVNKTIDDELKNKENLLDFDEHHLDCLLNPDKHPTVIRLGNCDCSEEQKEKCKNICEFNAMVKDDDGNFNVIDDRCLGCSKCIESCIKENITDRKDLLPIFELINNDVAPVYAMIAPAFMGQFSEDVTPGKLRSAFKALGFSGMIEVALFADILTLKEALEFDHSIKTDEDFLLTSCCCPMWIGMIKKVYNDLVPHIPPSVSPMVACGRSIKKIHPEAKTVFIGPCVAKKAESREKDIADSTDYVMTFQEVKDCFKIAGIDPKNLEEDLRDHSSKAGRIYAHTGGVSEAIESTLYRLRPDRKIPFKSKQANGVPQCRELLNEIKEGKITANFLEGMGCVGGCVGGPKIIIDKEQGREFVENYGEEAQYKTPADNPYVIELLHRLGYETIETLLKNDNMFIRNMF